MRVLHFPPHRLHVLTPGDHPSASDVAAFVDRLLPDVARERMEAHLADCARCRDELAACTRLVRSAPPKRRRILVSGVSVAAAATIVFVVLSLPRKQVPEVVRERGSSPALGEIAVVSPRPRSTIASGDIRFVWRADSGAAGYKVIVTTQTGTTVWFHESTDTSITPQPEAIFVPGDEYYWRVESSRGNGGTASSQTESFRVVKR